jgi:hypothetical protein
MNTFVISEVPVAHELVLVTLVACVHFHSIGKVSVEHYRVLEIQCSSDRELSNEPKNIFCRPKLKEIQPISKNLSKLAISPSFLGCFGHS